MSEISQAELLKRVEALEAAGKLGLGAPHRVAGLGCPPGCPDELACEVSELLQLGSPRLALAVATGNPLIPYSISVRADFANTSDVDIPDAGNDVKVVQDTRIDEIKYVVQNDNTPAGGDSLINGPQGFNFNSGIEAKLKVVSGRGGGAGYEIYPNFTPLALIARKTPLWIITYTEGIIMDFHASVPLPFAPVSVTFAFEGRTSPLPRLIDMTNKECLVELVRLGWECDFFMKK